MALNQVRVSMWVDVEATSYDEIDEVIEDLLESIATLKGIPMIDNLDWSVVRAPLPLKGREKN